jgi:hypothetical protein
MMNMVMTFHAAQFGFKLFFGPGFIVAAHECILYRSISKPS